MSSLLEPEFEGPYNAWKADQTPAGNAAFLKAVDPVLDKAIAVHVGAGQGGPLLKSRARGMALKAVRSYDPARARLQAHLYSQLQGLRRVNRQQTQILRVPERVALDKYHLDAAEKDLAHVLGRAPSTAELADRTGFNPARIARVRSYRPPAAEGAFGDDVGGPPPSAQAGVRDRLAGVRELVYNDLSPLDQQIMEHAFGMHGRRALANHAIAQKVGRSPGAISQRKAKIQAALDQMADLNPL